MRNRLLTIAFCAGALRLSAAPGDTIWTARYNGPSERSDFAAGLAVDALGNVYVAGRSWDTTGGVNSRMDDYAVVKYDSLGRQVWVRRYDANCPAAGYRSDQATCLGLDAQGNLYVSGASYYNLNGDTNQDFLTIKYRPNGDTAWTRRYCAPSNPGEDIPYALTVRGNCLYVTGQSWTSNSPERYDYATLKYDTSGNLLWDRRYHGGAGSSSYEAARAIAVDRQGNVYVTGFSNHDPISAYDYVTVKYDASGNQQWVARYNGPLDMEDEACALALDSSGNYLYVTGYSYNPSADYLTVKYNTATGETVWTRRHNGSADANDFATAIAADPAGGVYVTGYSHDSIGGYNYTTLKYSAQGIREWIDVYDGPAGNTDQAWAVAVDADGNAYVTGESYDALLYGDFATIKYDRYGSREWVARYNGQVNRRDKAVSVTVDNRDHAYVTGFSFNPQYNEDYLTIKYDARPVHDVGALRIVAPCGLLDSGAFVTPQAWLRNWGSTETFPVRMTVGSTAIDSLVTLASGESLLKSFTQVQLLVRGVSVVKCSTRLATDERTGNDRALDSVRIAVHDVALRSILSPADTAPPGSLVPRVSLRNQGTGRESLAVSFAVNASPPYLSVLSLRAGLPLNLDTSIPFPAWNANAGSYLARCSVRSVQDQVRANDTMSRRFIVIGTHRVDVAVSAILAPAGIIDPYDSVLPRARVRNLGDTAVSVRAFLRIQRLPNTLVFLDSATIPSLAVGDSATVAFAPWPPYHSGYLHAVRCSVAASGDIHAENNLICDTVQVVHLPHELWGQNPDVPAGPRNKKVKDGGCLAVLPEPESLSLGSATDRVYALKGNGTCEFYCYSAGTGGWTTLESIPATGSSGRKKAVKKGACMAAAAAGPSACLCAAKGNGTLEWWRYDPVLSAAKMGTVPICGTVPDSRQPQACAYPWKQMTDVPIGASRVKQGAGAASVRISDTDYVYLLKGSGTREFYRYNVLRDAWETMTSAPAGASGKTFKDGSCLAAREDGRFLFALKGNYSELFAYDVAANSWQTKTALPLVGSSGRKKKAKSGAGLTCRRDSVFCLKGGNTGEFWVYQTTADCWMQMPDMPLGAGKSVKGGGALATGNWRYLWALKGNNTLEFWHYHLCSDCLEPDCAGKPIGLAGPAPANPSLTSTIPTRAVRELNVNLAGPCRLRLYDISGREVLEFTQTRSSGSADVQLPVAHLAKGVYILRLDGMSANGCCKLIIE